MRWIIAVVVVLVVLIGVGYAVLRANPIVLGNLEEMPPTIAEDVYNHQRIVASLLGYIIISFDGRPISENLYCVVIDSLSIEQARHDTNIRFYDVFFDQWRKQPWVGSDQQESQICACGFPEYC
jgi:hypothetical protein